LHKKGLAPKDIHTDMIATPRKNVPSYAVVESWVGGFECDNQSLEDDPCPGRHVTVAALEMVNQVHNIVMTLR
jgi:hypothetical protein